MRGVLTSLLPLLVFVMGYGAFAGERERGTLRQIMAAGAGQAAIFAGKLIAIGGVGVCVALVVIAIATTAAADRPGEDGSALDTIARGAACLSASRPMHAPAQESRCSSPRWREPRRPHC